MKFKIDENLPHELAADLAAAGHEADTVVQEGLGGVSDPVLMKAAVAEGRVLLTLDKGIANLQHYPAHRHAGVVLFRPDRSGRKAVLAFIRERLETLLELQLPGRLTVVTPLRIRIRS